MISSAGLWVGALVSSTAAVLSPSSSGNTSAQSSFSMSVFNSHLNTRALGRSLEYHLETESTMTLASSAVGARGGEQSTSASSTSTAATSEGRVSLHGAAFLAESQTKGVGRRSRSWKSEPQGNIYVSFVWTLDTSKDFTEALKLNFVCGLAVVRACNSVGLDTARVKWPNDVWVESRKLSGALVNLTSSSHAIVGIGINVNQNIEECEEIKHIATGIRRELALANDETVSREKVLASLFNSFEELMALPFEDILGLYSRVSLLDGRRVRVHHTSREVAHPDDYEAVVIGMGDIGELKVRKEDGSVVLLSGEEVSISPLL